MSLNSYYTIVITKKLQSVGKKQLLADCAMNLKNSQTSISQKT
jgi:hypothetical protein